MSYSMSPDFLRCHSDENLRYYGAESEVEALTDSMNAVSLTSVACTALERYAKGKNVDQHTAQLALLLKNPSNKNFSHLSLRDIQANILLVLCRYSHQQRPEDLLLLSLMLPYYISILSKNSEEYCCGIISEELVQCLDSPDFQLIHDLDLRVVNFLNKNTFCRYSKNTELEYLAKLLKKITSTYQYDIQDAFIKSLQVWVKATQPEPARYAAVIRRVTELTCTLSTAEKCPVLTYFSYMHQLDVGNQSADEFLKELYTWQISEFTAGNDISSYIGCMQSVLLGQERLRYTEFSNDHKLANVWLLTKGWEQTQDPRYLDVLILALPHAASHLHTLVHMPTTARVIAGNIQKDNSNIEKFGEVLVASHVHFDVEAAATALNTYSETVRASVEEMAAAVQLFTSVLAHPYVENTDFRAKITYELLERYSQKSKLNADSAFYVLHFLSCDSETTSILQWTKALTDEGAINLFVLLVNSPNFSKLTQKALFKNLVAANMPPACLELAAKLLPSITAVHLPLLLNRLTENGQGPALDLFARQVAFLSLDVKEMLIRALAHRAPFVTLFERSLRKDPSHPGMDFLIEFVNSNSATEAQREALFIAFCHAKAPRHYLGFAPRILKSGQQEKIHKFTDMLIERMKEDADCPAMESFLGGINDGSVDWLVRNDMCRYLLSKNTPESIFLLSKMSMHISLSALWTLLKRIEMLQPQTAQDHDYRRLALKNLICATWYGDHHVGRNAQQQQVLLHKILVAKKEGKVFRPLSDWFENRRIILYNVTDSYALRIPAKIRLLMRTCGLSGNKLQALPTKKIERLVEGQIASRKEGKRKAPSYYKNFVLSIAGAAHNRRLEEEALRQAALAIEAVNKEEAEEMIERPSTPEPESQE